MQALQYSDDVNKNGLGADFSVALESPFQRQLSLTTTEKWDFEIDLYTEQDQDRLPMEMFKQFYAASIMITGHGSWQ
jgi:hypothetical protein